MKKLGLIGGTGPESTIVYYRALTYGVKNALGADFFPNLNIESLSVFEVLKFCESKDYVGLTDYLLKGIESLANAGAQVATFTGITPHIVFDLVAKKSPIQLVSIIGASCEYTQKQGFERVALLATTPTMNGTFFQKPFSQKGIEVILPNADEMAFIGNKIKSEIKHGEIIEATKAQFVRIAERLVNEDKAQAVILGCTELPLLFGGMNLSAPFIDVLAVHIDKLINIILEK